MLNNEVSIVTGWGDHLGTGHIQRMANLADFMNRRTSLRAFIINNRKPEFLPLSLHDLFSETIRPGSKCIIKDKRDSSINDMEKLKGSGRVIAIDDCGPGRELADLAIDLLPNLKFSINTKELFIYGYAFSHSIKALGDRPIRKDIDYALYFGITPSRETVDFLLSLLPEKSSCAILAGDASCFVNNGTVLPLKKSYAETLVSARVLISHFGITLYEGYIAGCRLVTINPTDYHSRLSDIAREDLNSINLGVLGALDTGEARSTLSNARHNTVTDIINPAKINEKIEEGLNLFLSRIQSFFE